MKSLVIGAIFTAFLSIFAGCANEGSTPSNSRAASAGNMQSANLPADQGLRQDMRKLWSEHVVWTRDYIVAAAADADDQKASLDRLMKNQEDIGNAISNYYSKAAGDKLTSLLKEHIQIAGELLKAAKDNDTALVHSTDRRWHRNADQIADFLSQANPNWSKAALTDLMNKHLSTTTTEVMARLHKDWNGDVKAFDAVYDHILMMSDALSDGIIKQFPDKFSGSRTVASAD